MSEGCADDEPSARAEAGRCGGRGGEHSTRNGIQYLVAAVEEEGNDGGRTGGGGEAGSRGAFLYFEGCQYYY